MMYLKCKHKNALFIAGGDKRDRVRIGCQIYQTDPTACPLHKPNNFGSECVESIDGANGMDINFKARKREEKQIVFEKNESLEEEI